MFTVALIGPDGAGKTTVCGRVARSLSLPNKYVYMGINLDASKLMLPTTWLLLATKRALGRRADMSGPPDPTRQVEPPRGLPRRAAASVKAWLRLANLVAEEWFRQIVVWCYVWRGKVVLFDRHFFVDYYASDIAPGVTRRPLHRRLHGFLLRCFLPRPNLVICLDAPAEVLFARKGEGTIEYLQQRRRDYQEMRHHVKEFVTVDATQPTEEVTSQVLTLIHRFHNAQTIARPQDVPQTTPVA